MNKNAPRILLAIGARLLCVNLPAKMRESCVSLSHLVNFISLANRVALPLEGLEYLGGQGFLHRNPLPGISKIHQPPERQSELTVGRDFQRHLISSTTNTA